ncbi:M48 family metallopeptidase [Pyxidicoccus xibeiensis]|uniref:M48 family metallopeptidase n=1 Tax=Pyxidicoccus xibeiensis TaxID=2906759 RepID=UPI0020A798BF|nr:YgjP-like metallopeptidase domain-containing protein [Pyxidicoccus xibeiensis]MCP3137785.1 M48 family metallopeptidase [Pyxidicoccus xibeiensis]
MSVALERSEVRWGNTRIPYGIRRSGRRTTVALTVSPPGQVLLTAPRDTPLERLDAVVHAKAKWIASRLRAVRPPEPMPGPREFVGGESFLYLGRQYRLEVRAGGEDTGVRLGRGRLQVQVPGGRTGQARSDAVREALVGWYRAHALARLAERTAWWARRARMPEPRVLIREQEKRWGSCSRGVVRFNWRIIQAPMRLVDYVVAHEVVHLLHDAHGREFWAALGRLLPDYEARRARLLAEGPRFIW